MKCEDNNVLLDVHLNSTSTKKPLSILEILSFILEGFLYNVLFVNEFNPFFVRDLKHGCRKGCIIFVG